MREPSTLERRGEEGLARARARRAEGGAVSAESRGPVGLKGAAWGETAGRSGRLLRPDRMRAAAAEKPGSQDWTRSEEEGARLLAVPEPSVRARPVLQTALSSAVAAWRANVASSGGVKGVTEAQAERRRGAGAEGPGRVRAFAVEADGPHGAALHGQGMHIPPTRGRASQANAAATALSSVGTMLGAGAIANALVRAARWCFRGWAGTRGAIQGEGEVTTERCSQGGGKQRGTRRATRLQNGLWRVVWSMFGQYWWDVAGMRNGSVNELIVGELNDSASSAPGSSASGERGATAGGGAGASDMGGDKSVRGDTVAPEEGSATEVTPEKLNRARRRAVARRQRRYARLEASWRERSRVLTTRAALEGKLRMLPPVARRRRVAMWRRAWRRRLRRRQDGVSAGESATGRPGAAAVVEGHGDRSREEQTALARCWDVVWAIPARVWNALMRAIYGNKLHGTSTEVAVISTLNVAGRMRLRGVGEDTEEWGTGDDLAARATEDWNRVERWMQGRALVVLTDLCVSGRQLRAMCARLRRDTWECYGTPGHFNKATGERTAGVLVVWDARCYVIEGHACVRSGRVVAVRLQDCRAAQAFTVFGAYMPVRGRPEREVRPAWEALGDAVADAGQGRIILGDLNAELPDALGREGRQPRLADELLRELCEEEHFITAGPDQATYTHGGREGQQDHSQIDHILCDASVAPTLGESEVLPGLSSEDHWMLQAGLLRQVGTQAGPQRCGKLPLWELDAGEWSEYAAEAEGEVDNAVRGVPEGRHACRLRSIEEALMGVARRLLARKRERLDGQRAPRAPGSGHRSAEERLRSDVGRWEALSRVVAERDSAHRCYLPLRVHDRGSRRAFARVKELVPVMRAGNLSSEQRRQALQHVCQRELAKARAGLERLRAREGDGFVEAFEEAINEGGEGGVCVRLFEILKAATGKGRKIKWRGQKQEGKTSYKGGRKPPVKLSSLYKDGCKDSGVVTGAKEVLAEVRKQAAATNGVKESFPTVARALMACIRPFPETQQATSGWADEVCTWERFESAVGRAGADVGVGSDGYCGYLMRKAPLAVRRLYFDALRGVLTSCDFPTEWKLWECVLLMKPGEDPRDFGRRRDVWLMPHSLKVAARMLMCEFERACEGYVPASQSGFSQDANAPSQTLVLRMHRERCHERKQGYYVLYADMGSYFMSICKEIQLVAEQWTGTRVEVSAVLRAMQDGLQGRVETAFGGTEPHDMPGVACGQGHECSPVRSKIMASFIQAMASQVCRGYRFGQTGVPQCWYCDDSAWMCEDLAGVQMALDAMWVVARVSGLQVTVKEKDFETRKGSKTAWMGVYYDEAGRECEVTGARVEMVSGRMVPQVREYKYLGTPLQIGYEGRHDAMRAKVVGTCCALIRKIGRVDMLGPRQTRRAMELAIAGVMGYYCRSTPMTWAGCEKIEAVRASVLAQRGMAAETPRAAIFLPEEAGGAGHMHAYAYAAAAYMDQFHRALSGGAGEPARVVVSERIAETCRRLGCTEAPLTWVPPEDMALSEDNMVEAWLLAKRRAGMRGVQTDALLSVELMCCSQCRGWRGRVPGSGPACMACAGPAAAEGGVAAGAGIGGGGNSRNTDGERGEGAGGGEEDGGDDVGCAERVLRARRTAGCFGGWEYLLERGSSRVWVAHTRMVADGVGVGQLEEAQRHRSQAHSMRALLETRYGRGRPGSVGQMEAAISGRAGQPETELKLGQLTREFIVHAEDQRAAEIPTAPWPNLWESPRREGYRGVEYEPGQGVSYYRGVREATEVVDGVQQYRSRMGLEPQAGSREARLPAEMRVGEDEVSRVAAQGDPQLLPECAPHLHMSDMGLRDAAKPQLRRDPVARLHLRLKTWEGGGVVVKTASGVEVESGRVNQEAFESRGDEESGHSLRGVCLPLHYRHRFTRAASVDGSAVDPRRHGGGGGSGLPMGSTRGCCLRRRCRHRWRAGIR